MSEIKETMLTTIDNPYNPFKQWDQWLAFDEQKGYYTCNYLARIATNSDSLSEVENAEIIDAAMDDIIKIDPLGIYMKIAADDTPLGIPVNPGGGS